MDTTYPPDITPPRPTFLTVICILSFIGSGWGLLSGTMQALAPPDLVELQVQMQQATDGMDQLGSESPFVGLAQGAMEAAMKEAEHARSIGMVEAVLSAISLYGVWLMWNLRRMGFFVYVVAGIAGLAAPLYFLGNNWFALMSLGIGGLFTVLFILLYALNLKHMVR